MEGRRRLFLPSQYWASDEPVKVQQIHVLGTPYTNEDVVQHFLRQARSCTSANELHASLMDARTRLMRLGIFRDIHFVVDTAQTPGEAQIGVSLDELPRKEYGVGAGSGGVDRLVLSGTLSVLNMFGRAESWRSSVSYAPPGFQQHFAVDGALRKPLLFRGEPYQEWGFAVHYSDTNRQSESKHLERALSVNLSYLYGGVGWRVGHELRRLMPSLGASFANLRQSGWSQKSSLGVEWGRDTRDNPLLPNHGILGRASLELAVDTARRSPLFAKLEGVYNVTLPVAGLLGGSLTLRGRTGHVLPLVSSSETSAPPFTTLDLFHLGGGHSVPGFNTRGIGRTPNEECLGAQSYWLLSAHYLFPFGASMPAFLRGHLHASACAVSDVFGGASKETTGFLSLFSPDALRAAVGVGLVAALPGTGRLTLTYSRVLRQQLYDSTNSFIQLGFTATFD